MGTNVLLPHFLSSIYGRVISAPFALCASLVY